jgi:hypothetical protein
MLRQWAASGLTSSRPMGQAAAAPEAHAADGPPGPLARNAGHRGLNSGAEALARRAYRHSGSRPRALGAEPGDSSAAGPSGCRSLKFGSTQAPCAGSSTEPRAYVHAACWCQLGTMANRALNSILPKFAFRF